MKYTVDSLDREVYKQEQYIDNLRKKVAGESTTLDTTKLKVPKDEFSDD